MRVGIQKATVYYPCGRYDVYLGWSLLNKKQYLMKKLFGNEGGEGSEGSDIVVVGGSKTYDTGSNSKSQSGKSAKD
jgi:hypothetical protein